MRARVEKGDVLGWTKSLNVAVMFQIHLFYYKHIEEENVVEDIAIKCIYCNRSTGLFLNNKQSNK